MLFLEADENHNVIKWPVNELEIRQRLSNVSFPENLVGVNLERYGFYAVEPVKPPRRSTGKKVVLDTPVWDEETKKFVRRFKEIDRTKEEVDGGWVKLRTLRDRKLIQTDWTQLSDAPLSKEQKKAWKDYRQALRDITSNVESPFDVVWPKIPE